MTAPRAPRAPSREWRKVVALSGGVGGARFLHGLSRVLAPEALTAIVNTGDDFEHWGLAISPDVDTVVYTLADLAHEERGWGLAEETFHALEMMRKYGAPDWFGLGDRDLAMHLVRTEALRRGETLSAVTARLASALGVACRVLPMADGPCRTRIVTEEHGALAFQDWFVRLRAAPRVWAVTWEGAPPAAPGVLEAIAEAELVVIGPSNPYVSIDPILALPGVREAVLARPLVAVSPIVHGAAVKGPLARMIQDLARVDPTPAAIARHYGARLGGIVVESGDERALTDCGAKVLATTTVMKTRADSSRLAREVLGFAEGIA
jgi:LPPG:FO 2-phospho-L-lactate transferase